MITRDVCSATMGAMPTLQASEGPLIDKWQRPVTELRISLNSSLTCNFRCIHCHSEGIHEDPAKLMAPSEIQRIVHVLAEYSVASVKLTGGEPMLRPDIISIIRGIREEKIREISMTTNGTRLDKLAFDLRKAGLDRVNVSLHSLREDRYNFITGACSLKKTLTAIESAVNAGLTPVKINMTLLRGVNEDEVDDVIDYVREMGGGELVILQLIELVDSDPEFYEAYHVNLTPIEEKFSKSALSIVKRRMHGRLKYHLPNGVYVETVRPMHNSEFCAANNRIRITYDGKFKPCLLREDNHVDFLTAMRSGAGDEELKELYRKAVSLREPFFKP